MRKMAAASQCVSTLSRYSLKRMVPTVSGPIIDRDWCAADLDIALRTRWDVDVVISCAVMRDVLQTLWQRRDELFVKGTGDACGFVRTVYRDYVVVRTALHA